MALGQNGFYRWVGLDHEFTVDKVDCFRSYFYYPEDEIKGKFDKSIKGYNGIHNSDYFPIDIDSDNLEESYQLFQIFAKKFKGNYFFSGKKGFHILIPSGCFRWTPSNTLHKQFKQFAEANLKGADLSIYDISRVLRVVNTKHSGTGLYKIQITPDMSLDTILELAKTPQPTWFEDCFGYEYDFTAEEQQPLYKQINHGQLQDGNRNNTMVSLVGRLVGSKLDPNTIVTLAMGVDVDDKAEFTESKIRIMVDNLYNRQNSEFILSKKGDILSLLPNYVVAIERLQYKIKYNTFDSNIYLDNDPLSDENRTKLAYELTSRFTDLKNDKIIDQAIMFIAYKNKYDSLVNYIKTLVWDGKKRVDTLLIDLYEADDNQYTRLATRVNLIGAIKRATTIDGYKHDTMLVLVGEQGLKKSSFFEMLSTGLYNTAPINLNDKDAYQELDGSWIIEFAEMNTYKKSDLDRLKDYLVKKADTYRRSYARYVTRNPRRCVFMGTSNRTDFLRDNTGERRFHPIAVKSSHFENVDKNFIDQVWAEAYVLSKTEKSYIDPKENQEFDQYYKEAIEGNKAHDDLEDFIISQLAHMDEVFDLRDLIISLGYTNRDLADKALTNRISSILRNLGLERKRVRDGEKLPYKWIKNN
jgi:hypothetical protein